MPTLLFAALTGAFWLSFSVESHELDADVWPLVWLGLLAVLLLPPIPVYYKPSRYWLFNRLWKLLTSGMHRVEVRGRYAKERRVAQSLSLVCGLLDRVTLWFHDSMHLADRYIGTSSAVSSSPFQISHSLCARTQLVWKTGESVPTRPNYGPCPSPSLLCHSSCV
jgi:hypothetical protein